MELVKIGKEYSEEELKKLTKPVYHYTEKVSISKIQIETSRNDENDLRRIRLISDDREITLKPQKVKKESRGVKGFEIISEIRDVYTIENLEEEFPVLFKLANDLKEKKQEVIMTYVEKPFYSEKERELETFYYMMPKHIKLLHYSGFHKDNKMIEEQKEMQQRYSKKEL